MTQSLELQSLDLNLRDTRLHSFKSIDDIERIARDTNTYLGRGGHSVVVMAEDTVIGKIALKIFNPFDNHGYRSAQIPFELELVAFDTIQKDAEAAGVVAITCYDYAMLSDHNVLIKEVVQGAPFANLTFRRLKSNRDILDRLRIVDRDVKFENFIGGRICDLSYASTRGTDEDIREQWYETAAAVLRYFGYDPGIRQSTVESAWNIFIREKELDSLIDCSA